MRVPFDSHIILLFVSSFRQNLITNAFSRQQMPRVVVYFPFPYLEDHLVRFGVFRSQLNSSIF